MTLHDDDRPGEGRTSARRRRLALGAVGLAAVLGGGAYLITSEVVDHRDSTATTDTGALAPMISPASASATPSAFSSASPSAGASTPGTAATSAPARAAAGPAPRSSAAVSQEIKEARAKAAKDGVPLMRARTAAPDVPSGPVSERTEPRKNGVLRIVTAKFDLRGQRELLWPANGGKPVGDAECTQTFRFSNEAKASTKRNLLLCWRTSATKSVVTALVDRSGKPSAAESVGIIDREWAKLG
jgi:hypothetical protein